VEMPIELFGHFVSCQETLVQYDSLYPTLKDAFEEYKHKSKRRRELDEKMMADMSVIINKSQENMETCTQQVVNLGLKNKRTNDKLIRARNRTKFWCIVSGVVSAAATYTVQRAFKKE
jgi:hypothetical protein